MHRCTWNVAGADINVAGVSALPGGAWAYDESTKLMAAAGLSEPVTTPIDGVDRAAFGCRVA